jgi:hypothetical protein
MDLDESPRTANIERHSKRCRICSHRQREDIERDFIRWRSPAEIAKTYHLKDRSTVYRHAQALNLYPRRQRNVRAALERIIEKAGEVEVTAGAVVAAVQAYAKINAAGQWIERTETVNLHELFERMTQDELEAYARDGKLPAWFPQNVTATPPDSPGHPSD